MASRISETLQREVDTPKYEGILTGHFKRSHFYATQRSFGTSDWLVIYTVSGQGRFGFAGGERVAGAGDWVVLKPATPHDYRILSRDASWEILWAHFHPPAAWLAWMNWPEISPGLLWIHLTEKRERQWIIRQLRIMHEAAMLAGAHRKPLAMNALEGAVLFLRNLLPDADGKMDPRVRQACDYLAARVDAPFSLAALSRHVGLSSWRLAHLFREQLGGTPRETHERLRLNRARELLVRTRQPISEIAYSLGFENPFYFSRRFRLAAGVSPREFRNRES